MTNSRTALTETASPADDERWNYAHEVTIKVDRVHFWHVIRNERILKTIERRVPEFKSKSFLEIGCGVGNVIGYLHEHGIESCTGWDINLHALDLAKQRFPKVKLQERNFLLPLQAHEQAADIVGLFDALEHFEDDFEIVSRMRQLVRPGGTAVITVPAMMSLWSSFDEYYGHYRRYDGKQLTQLLTKAGFTDVRATYFMAPLCMAKILRKQEARVSDAEMNQRLHRDSFLSPASNALAKFLLRTEQAVLGDNDLGFGAALIVTAKNSK